MTDKLQMKEQSISQENLTKIRVLFSERHNGSNERRKGYACRRF